MNEIADRENFIVVYPQGTGNFWNDGRERAPKVDDVGFIRALMAHLEKMLTIDRRRIYAAGISNGGMMTQRLACELSDKIAAIASVAASMPENYSPQCRPTATISVLLIHGTDDPLVPYRGGPLSAASNIGGSVWSVADTIKYWVAHDKCNRKPAIDYLPDKDPNESSVTRRESYAGCAKATDVVLLTVEGGGHTWPGANPYLPESRTGRTTKDFDGSEAIWSFFKKQSKN
jgi:polyhydroxybutyrate depolymerase